MLKVYAVFDKKVGAYTQPIFMRTDGEAIRSFGIAVADGKSQFGMHPEDYYLARVGEWDDSSGVLTGHSPVVVIEAEQLVRR